MTTKLPKAKIIRMQKLLDEALGLWPVVRDWYEATEDAEMRWPASDLDAELHAVVAALRDLRREVEG